MKAAVWIHSQCRFAQAADRNPPVRGQFITLPGNPSVILVEKIDKGQDARGGKWWTARGTDDQGNSKVLNSFDQAIKNGGWVAYRGEKPSFFVLRERQRNDQAERENQQALADSFRTKFKMRPGTLLSLNDLAASHPMLGAFHGYPVQVKKIDYETNAVSVCAVEEPSLCVEAPAEDLVALATPALPQSASKMKVKTPYGTTLQDLVDNVPDLASLVAQGRVRAKATVYPNDSGGNGFEIFKNHMGMLGVDTDSMTEGVHYVLNNTKDTVFLRPYTGEIFIQTPGGVLPQQIMDEIQPMIDERSSQVRPMSDGKTIHIHNNPLFRAVVGLGAWS